MIKHLDLTELPDAIKAMRYEEIFGDNSIHYTKEEREDGIRTITEMIRTMGAQSAAVRIATNMLEIDPSTPQESLDALYNAVLWLDKITSRRN